MLYIQPVSDTTVGISMTQTIIWQQRNTIKITEIIHQDHSMQHNLIKTTSNGRITPHTLVLQAEKLQECNERIPDIQPHQ